MNEGYYSLMEGSNAPDIVGFSIALIFFIAGLIITLRGYIKHRREIKRMERESGHTDK